MAVGGKRMNRVARFLPLVLLALLIAGLVWRLTHPADTAVHSQLEGKPVPAFALPAALPGKPALSSDDLASGKPTLVNVFASWCVPCITEVGVLKQLQARGVPIEGIAVRDRPEDLAEFLARNGDPYGRIGSDQRSQVQLSLGSSGVPESFIVDGKGIIRFQHVGAIAAEDIPTVLAEMDKAR
jgi:cytochrome c biogenesis protein CcmG/thiol:disulfide interchange protein DsbE